MNYSFDNEHAKKYGVDEAILLNNFIFWIKKNKANGKHFYDGRYWTYNSMKAFSELFEFWTEKQLRRILKSLSDQGVLMTGNHNSNPFDNTNWYAFVNQEEFLGIENNVPKREDSVRPNGQVSFAQMGTSITDINTDSKTIYTYGENSKNNVYRAFGHLRLMDNEFMKLIECGYSKSQIDSILDDIENYKKNKNYTSLYLTAKKWLTKETPSDYEKDDVTKKMAFKKPLSDDEYEKYLRG